MTPRVKPAEVEPKDVYLCLLCPRSEGQGLEAETSRAFFDHLEAEHPDLVERDEKGKRRVPDTKTLTSVHQDGDTWYSWEETFGTEDGTPFLARLIVRPRRRNDPMRF